MSAGPSASLRPMPSASSSPRVLGIELLRGLLIAEAALGLLLAIVLSMWASDATPASEQDLRFAAGFSFVFAIVAAIASRGARRRRSWSWTLSALLQLIIAISTGVAILTAAWHPAYLIGFVLPAIVMMVLSTASVRRALGQE
jgi:hypothetical protein